MGNKVTIPYLFTPRAYQLPFLSAMDGGAKRAVLVWNRRSGKDKTCWNFMIKKAFEKVGTYFYFLPSYTQAKKVIWDNIDNDGFKMLDHLPPSVVKKKNSTELKIDLINGSVIQLIGADTFETSSVGTNPVGVVFSEYSINDPTVFNYVRPILKANGGWAVFNFTPRGKNHAWNILQVAKENDWFNEILTIEDTKVISEKDLEEERMEGMPADLIDQEYFCKFVDDAGQFFRRVDSNCLAQEDNYNETHRYQMGVDLAKHQDYTVITVFNMMTFREVYKERFNQLDYNLQKAKIENIYLRYGKPLIYIDSTGVGEPIYDDLSAKKMNIEPYTFTAKSREDLLRNLQLLLEQDKIKPIKDEITIDELKSFRYELGNMGKLKIQVPDGLHDDTVFSLALAVWDIPLNPLQAKTEDNLRYLRLPKDGGGQVETTNYE